MALHGGFAGGLGSRLLVGRHGQGWGVWSLCYVRLRLAWGGSRGSMESEALLCYSQRHEDKRENPAVVTRILGDVGLGRRGDSPGWRFRPFCA